MSYIYFNLIYTVPPTVEPLSIAWLVDIDKRGGEAPVPHDVHAIHVVHAVHEVHAVHAVHDVHAVHELHAVQAVHAVHVCVYIDRLACIHIHCRSDLLCTHPLSRTPNNKQ